MELQLGLSLPIHSQPKGATDCIKRKRALTTNHLPQTLPLLSWNDKPNDEDDHPPRRPSFCNDHKKDEEKSKAVVGWPPIDSWRKKALHRRRPRQPVAANHTNQNSLFVKVKMEGLPIARKLDLTLYHSHHSLKTALIAMFTTNQAIDCDGWDFTLIYEDKDGDWLLAEDLPWNSFVESVQRLKILVRKRNKE